MSRDVESKPLESGEERPQEGEDAKRPEEVGTDMRGSSPFVGSEGPRTVWKDEDPGEALECGKTDLSDADMAPASFLRRSHAYVNNVRQACLEHEYDEHRYRDRMNEANAAISQLRRDLTKMEDELGEAKRHKEELMESMIQETARAETIERGYTRKRGEYLRLVNETQDTMLVLRKSLDAQDRVRKRLVQLEKVVERCKDRFHILQKRLTEGKLADLSVQETALLLDVFGLGAYAHICSVKGITGKNLDISLLDELTAEIGIERLVDCLHLAFHIQRVQNGGKLTLFPDDDDDDGDGDGDDDKGDHTSTPRPSAPSATSPCSHRPSNPALWSVRDVGHWLQENHLAQYVRRFAEEEINGEALVMLSLHDLSMPLGVVSTHHRFRLMDAIQTLHDHVFS